MGTIIAKKVLIIITIILLLLGQDVNAQDRLEVDLNGDNKITFTDISILKIYIVGIREIEQDYRNNADMNADGKISVTDLSILKMQIVGLGNVGEELDINSELVQELYRYVPDSSGDMAYIQSSENVYDRGILADAYSLKKITNN